MPVFRWGQGWDPFRDLEREMDRLLAGVSLSFQGVRFGQPYPPVNVYELPDELLLTAELPGTRVEDLEITVANGVLTLKGKHLGSPAVADEHYRRQERPRGNWQRSLTLPERIQEDGMSADFQLGVLRVRLPKLPAAPVRQIRIVETTPDSSIASPSPLKTVLPVESQTSNPLLGGPAGDTA